MASDDAMVDAPTADETPCWQIAGGPKGAKYDGELSIRGMAQGRGKLVMANGDTYEGEFKAGRMDGYGRMQYSDGDSYEGDWKHDEHHGRGKYLFGSGAYYEGELNMGNAEGQGVKLWDDGSKYVGEWRNNMYHGHGMKLDAEGLVVHNGEWKHDEPVTSKPRSASGSPTCTSDCTARRRSGGR